MRVEPKPRRWSRVLFRSIVLSVIVALLGVGALTLFLYASDAYPLLYVYLRNEPERTGFYRRCMDIQRGRTNEEVQAIMAGFRIASQKPNTLVFNTEKFSADLCSIRFSDEAVSRVTSVEFEPD